jgi:uncharacterized OB-fold protein
VREEFVLCPHCGVQLKQKCSSCGRTTAPDWNVCPYCGNMLKQ